MGLAVLIRIGQTGLGLLGQVLSPCMDGHRRLGSRRGSHQVQIAGAIVLAKSSRLIAVVAQGNASIAGDVHLFGRSALELHAAVHTGNILAICILPCMGTHFEVILEFYGNVFISIIVFLHFGQDIGLAAVPAVAVTAAEIRTPLRDTVVVRIHDTLPVRDTVRMFRWRDPWISVEGRIGRDSAACRIRSVDTLRQAVHRIPRRFLFIRWGTKALRQEIVSTHPHTRIVHAEYVKIER